MQKNEPLLYIDPKQAYVGYIPTFASEVYSEGIVLAHHLCTQVTLSA